MRWYHEGALKDMEPVFLAWARMTVARSLVYARIASFNLHFHRVLAACFHFAGSLSDACCLVVSCSLAQIFWSFS